MAVNRQKPNKVLAGRATSSIELEAWPYEDFPGDPWWQGGDTPRPYRWEITMTITAQSHGDPSTRNPYKYDGNDVFAGDWIADISTGRSLRIAKVLNKDSKDLTVVVEDSERYNTFMSPVGSGIFPIPGDILVFGISDMDMPILNPIPSSVTVLASFLSNVDARFQNNNPLYKYKIVQENHGLEENQSIWVNPANGFFEVAVGDGLKTMIGTVDRIVSPDIFYFIPTTKIIEEYNPVMPGSAGDVIYADTITGQLSITSTERTKAAFIQLTDPTPDTSNSMSDNPVALVGEQFSVNDVAVEIVSTGLQSIVDAVNVETETHGVVAELKAGVNTASSVSGDMAYGMCASIGTTTQATINGVLVTFDITTSGSAEFGFEAANAVDIATSINNAGIPDITAEGIGSVSLTLSHSAGGAIAIANITGDGSGISFAGSGSCTGVPLNTSPGGAASMYFENSRGNGIIFGDIIGTPVANLGLISTRNGAQPIALIVEQAIIESNEPVGMSVYQDLLSLPDTAIIGSQGYVVDSADANGSKAGEWSTWLWNGVEWTKTGDQDSASTDAKSMEIRINHDSSAEELIGTVSDLSRLSLVSVVVEQAFDGIPTLNIGDDLDPTRSNIMTDDDLDLSNVGSYHSTTGARYSMGRDVEILTSYDSGGATYGTAIVTISYQ